MELIGNQEDKELSKIRYQTYIRGVIQTFNLILELRQKLIKQEIKEQALYNASERSRSANNQGLSPTESYIGIKNSKINKTLLEQERSSLDMPTVKLMKSYKNSNQLSIGSLPSIKNRSRQNKTTIESLEKTSLTLPNTSKIEFTMYQETMKIQKAKNLMRNVLKNKLEQDLKAWELEQKMKEKAKKHDEALKQNLYEQQVKKAKKENKKMY